MLCLPPGVKEACLFMSLLSTHELELSLCFSLCLWLLLNRPIREVYNDSLVMMFFSGYVSQVISGHLGWVRSIAVEPGNQWFVTGSADRTIKVIYVTLN